MEAHLVDELAVERAASSSESLHVLQRCLRLATASECFDDVNTTGCAWLHFALCQQYSIKKYCLATVITDVALDYCVRIVLLQTARLWQQSTSAVSSTR
jgi:hypothetical protein